MTDDFADRPRRDTLVLFDVDGTLTAPRQRITPEMRQLLATLRTKVPIGFVGGSDLAKQKEQIGDDVLDLVDFAFSENGLVSFRRGAALPTSSFVELLGEDRYQQLVNFILGYLSTLELPFKRGTFIEFRRGMINVSPVGRNCSTAERDAFERFDLATGTRKKLADAILTRFPEYGLIASIGGQISFDLFPRGWDKTYCLRHLESEGFVHVHFFGDKTHPGGNDYEIFTDPRVIGHAVQTPDDTARILRELFELGRPAARGDSNRPSPPATVV